MKQSVKKLPAELKIVIHRVQDLSQKLRMPAYLVGGALRDLIQGVKNCDLDITVEGSGLVFARHLAKKLKAELREHERFGTATLILPNGLKVDIATSRREEYPYPAALPQVTFGSLKDDLGRRDFTINALALSLSGVQKNELIDPFCGRDDLSGGCIRIMHDLSFQDDPTRILRAVRFAVRFNFKIQPHTLKLLKAAVGQGWMDKVHPHRMRDELILILKEKNPHAVLKQLSGLGALSFISPGLKVDQAMAGLCKAIAKESSWFVKNFPGRRRLDTWLIYFAGLLRGFAPDKIEAIMQRLGFSIGDQKRVVSYYQQKSKLSAALSKKNALGQEIFSSLEPLSYETIILLRADFKNRYLKKHLADFFRVYNGMRLCVGGHDLGGLGVLPGPLYQKIFTKVLSAKLNGQVKGRRDELALIRKLIKTKA